MRSNKAADAGPRQSACAANHRELLVAAAAEDDAVIAAKVDLGLGKAFREHVFNFAKHRRPEHYRLIAQRVGAGDLVTAPRGA